ncbi:hypothetical protein Bca101_050398 [Brassica carinata]
MMNSDLPSLPASLVGGRVRPRCLFADPFSSPAAVHGDVPEADNEENPRSPSKQHCSYVLDDGPCSEIQEENLMAIRRRYAIHSSVFGGSFRHSWLRYRRSLVSAPSQLTPLSWRTLMSIQVLGELYGLDIVIHEVLYSYYFAPLMIMPGFYHLQPRDGTPLVEEPSRDVAHLVSFLWEAVAKHVLAISRCFRRVSFLLSKEVLRHSRLWGNIARLPALVLYDEYQQAGTRRRRSFYTPPPRLARATPTTSRIRSDSVGTPTGGVPLMVRALARWELMKEWLEGRTEHWDPEEEYRQYLLWSEGLGRHSGGFSQVNLRSVAESRVSAGPPF